jgi:hypothetical protein
LCGQTFGQSFTVPSVDTTLDSIGFNLTTVDGGSLNVVLRLYAWDGDNVVGGQLYASPVLTLTQQSKTFVDFSVGVNLSAGNEYIAFLDAAGVGNTASQDSGFYLLPNSTYSGGEFGWERITTITRDKIKYRVIHRWPDKIGERIGDVMSYVAKTYEAGCGLVSPGRNENGDPQAAALNSINLD